MSTNDPTDLHRQYERGLITLGEIEAGFAIWVAEQNALLAAMEQRNAERQAASQFWCDWCRGDGRGDHAADCAMRVDFAPRLGHCTPRWGGHSLACERDGRFCSKDSSHDGPCTPHISSFAREQSRATRPVGPCPCECNSGGFCGGCGHAGCSGGINLRGR